MGFSEDEEEIHKLYESIGEKKGRSWSKYKWDVITRTVIGLLSNHLPPDYTITEPNGYIDGCPVEFDILILRKNSVPVLPYSNVHEREDGKSIIECKKQEFFYKKSLAQTKIAENFKNLERAGLPYKYITIRGKQENNRSHTLRFARR